jgi:hypothetical protein
MIAFMSISSRFINVYISMKSWVYAITLEIITKKTVAYASISHSDDQLQANLVLTTSFSLTESDLGGFETYLNDIVGFFVIEYYVFQTTEGLRNRSNIDALWDAATAKLYEVISQSLQDCQNPDHYLKIKELMITFIQTMEEYDYAVNRVVELLMAFFERYSDLMKSRANQHCHDAILQDEGNPVTAHSMTDYNHVIAAYAYKDPNEPKQSAAPTNSVKKQQPTTLVRIRFPKLFPFSASFVECAHEIKRFINGFYLFAEGFHQKFNEMDDILKKAVELLLSLDICTSIEEKLALPNLQLSEIVRVIINIEHLECVIPEFEDLIIERRSSHRIVSPRNASMKANQDKLMLASLATACQPRFTATRKRAENKIFEVVNRKIDDFLELSTYEWMLAFPSKPGSPTKPSPFATQHDGGPSLYLIDLVAFLTTVWTSTLAELPVEIKSFVYYDAIYHLSSALLGLMLSSNVKKISPLYIDHVFCTDLEFIESFVAGLGDANLPDQVRLFFTDRLVTCS